MNKDIIRLIETVTMTIKRNQYNNEYRNKFYAVDDLYDKVIGIKYRPTKKMMNDRCCYDRCCYQNKWTWDTIRNFKSYRTGYRKIPSNY